MSQPVILKLIKDGKVIEVKQFLEEEIVIGSGESVQFRIDDESVFAIHASIEKRDNSYFISDMGSANGTFKDGQKILEEELSNGDKIQLGNFEINVVLPPSASSSKDKPVSPVKAEAAPAKPVEAAPQFSSKSTFKPEKNIEELIRPEKGTSVEVLCVWKDKVISTKHFHQHGSVTIGSSPDCDLEVPLVGASISKHKLLKIGSQVEVFVTPDMTGEYYSAGSGKKLFADLLREQQLVKASSGYKMILPQGEMLRIDFQGGLISIYIRFVPESPRPIMAPILDLTASEVTGVILAAVVASIFGLYMMVYAPLPEEETPVEEPFRKAVVKFNPPKPKTVVKAGNVSKKKVVKIDAAKKAKASAKKSGKTGKAANLKRRATKKKTNKFSSTVKKGGAIKTGASGANAASKRKDPKKVGLLSVFGSKGAQNKLNKVYSGAGELAGIAGAATGKAGQKDNRAGVGLGARLKGTDAGGTGRSTVGISGVGTKGRGSGTVGYGTGGIGSKANSEINIGGAEEAFVGSIDREAIRRVILDNIRQIRVCYERELNKFPDLYGKIVLEWDIIEKGKATNAKVISNEMGNARVARCVMRSLVTWRFPEPPEDQIARVTYPFLFSAK